MMKDVLGEDIMVGDYVVYSPRTTCSMYAGVVTRETAMQIKVSNVPGAKRGWGRTVDKRYSRFEVLKITKEQYERIND